MSKWDTISLFKFQQIDIINSNNDYDAIDKIGFSVCTVFDLTQFQLESMKQRKATRLCEKVADIFTTPPVTEAEKKVGKFYINYDISEITLGQYTALSFYLTNQIQQAHNTLACVAKAYKEEKYNADNHIPRANYFLTRSISKITGTLSAISKNFAAFNKKYEWLFGLDSEVHEPNIQTDPFIKRFGWVFAAKQISLHKDIPLDDAYKLPITEAFNDLAYLKAKGKFDEQQLKKNGR